MYTLAACSQCGRLATCATTRRRSCRWRPGAATELRCCCLLITSSRLQKFQLQSYCAPLASGGQPRGSTRVQGMRTGLLLPASPSLRAAVTGGAGGGRGRRGRRRPRGGGLGCDSARHSPWVRAEEALAGGDARGGRQQPTCGRKTGGGCPDAERRRAAGKREKKGQRGRAAWKGCGGALAPARRRRRRTGSGGRARRPLLLKTHEPDPKPALCAGQQVGGGQRVGWQQVGASNLGGGRWGRQVGGSR